MKKHLLFVAMTLVVFAMVFLFSACGGSGSDDVNNGGSSGSGINSGWYIAENTVQSKVNDLSNMANEWITDGITNFFDSYGQLHFDSHNVQQGNTIIAKAGWVEWESGTDRLVAIHIINNNTLEAYFGGTTYRLYASGASGKQLLFAVNLGSVIGTVGFYADYKRIYTYDYIDKNRFFFGLGTDGVYEEFNTVNGQLYQNGGGTWSKFDPSSVYQGNVTATPTNNGGGSTYQDRYPITPNVKVTGDGIPSTLKNLLGIGDIDLLSTSYTTIANRLQKNYTLSYDVPIGSTDKDGFQWFHIWEDNNTSQSKNMSYQGLSFYDFYIFDIPNYSKNVRETLIRSISFSFWGENISNTPWGTLDKIINEFKNIGIPIKYDKNWSGSVISSAGGEITIENTIDNIKNYYNIKVQNYNSDYVWQYKWVIDITYYTK